MLTHYHLLVVCSAEECHTAAELMPNGYFFVPVQACPTCGSPMFPLKEMIRQVAEKIVAMPTPKVDFEPDYEIVQEGGVKPEVSPSGHSGVSGRRLETGGDAE